MGRSSSDIVDKLLPKSAARHSAFAHPTKPKPHASVVHEPLPRICSPIINFIAINIINIIITIARYIRPATRFVVRRSYLETKRANFGGGAPFPSLTKNQYGE
jgi:hypothetical protein